MVAEVASVTEWSGGMMLTVGVRGANSGTELKAVAAAAHDLKGVVCCACFRVVVVGLLLVLSSCVVKLLKLHKLNLLQLLDTLQSIFPEIWMTKKRSGL